MLLLSLLAHADGPHHNHGHDGHHDNHGHPDEDTCDDGTVTFFAEMPVDQPTWPITGPTYPEGVGIIDDRVIISGPANFGTAGNGSPSQLTVFDRETGNLVSEVPVVGEFLDFEHALSELAVWHDYAYAPSTQLGVLRWDFHHDDTPTQESVSTPFCSVTGVVPCHLESDACPADVRPGLPPLPNGITVDRHGDVYVTDSLQGIVWRIDDDGTPEVLVCSRALQGSADEGLGLFGANGIAVVDDILYVGVTFGPMGPTGPTSSIYRIDLDDPELELVYSFDPVQVAPGIFVPPILDGLTWDDDAEVLLAVLGGQNALVELDVSECEVEEVGRIADDVMYNPSTVAVDDGDTFVTNHAITACLDGSPDPTCTVYGAADLFGVLQVCRD